MALWRRVMRAVDLINDKRVGRAHRPGEISWLVRAFLGGDVPDYQISAWLMAVVWRGLTVAETAELTTALVESGRRLSFRDLPVPVVDKHSTGGVGDKTTLVLVPMLAAVGCAVAKMSGRGLGHSGGTIDKLEAIPGVSTTFDIAGFEMAVRERGMVIAAQSPEMAPGDGRLYALRDVTGTVESVPLIASSVMSKKIATGARAVVLDVKVGDGAFMATVDKARELARAMVDLGSAAGLSVVAVLTDMDGPLGRAVGNLLEVREAIETVSGTGDPALRELCIVLGSEVMLASGAAAELDEARTRLQAAIDDGTARARLRSLIVSLGGDGAVVDDPTCLETAPYRTDVITPHGGTVSRVGARAIGEAAMLLGAGRATKSDLIDPVVGVVMHKQVGDVVQAGEAVATIHSRQALRDSDHAVRSILGAFTWTDGPVRRPPLVIDIVR